MYITIIDNNILAIYIYWCHFHSSIHSNFKQVKSVKQSGIKNNTS